TPESTPSIKAGFFEAIDQIGTTKSIKPWISGLRFFKRPNVTKASWGAGAMTLHPVALPSSCVAAHSPFEEQSTAAIRTNTNNNGSESSRRFIVSSFAGTLLLKECAINHILDVFFELTINLTGQLLLFRGAV